MISSVVVSMLRLPWWTRLPLAWQRCWISRKARERDANTDYRVLMARPPNPIGLLIETLNEFRGSKGTSEGRGGLETPEGHAYPSDTQPMRVRDGDAVADIGAVGLHPPGSGQRREACGGQAGN